MNRFTVIFSDNAVVNLNSSIEWGLENWGEEATFQWYLEFRETILDLLGSFPRSQPIAPENSEFDVDVHQLIIGRYRELFTIQKKTVVILHIRGSFSGNLS